jgi:hypothetical protein
MQTSGTIARPDPPVFAFMSSPADLYRQRAADAKKRAAQAKDPSVKRAFEEVAAGWRVLAEQMEWIDWQRSTLREEGGRD